jgi:hypothetical protein
MPPPLRRRRRCVVNISDIDDIGDSQYDESYNILVINNTPQKTYRIAQYTDSWKQLHSIVHCKYLVSAPVSASITILSE